MMFVFPHDIIVAYLFFVTLHATWTHSNFRPSIKWLEPFLISPRFHHWHHTNDEHRDHNYASMLPFVDRLFGTFYLPREWPAAYGIDAPMSEKLLDQFVEPFTPRRRGTAVPDRAKS